MCTPGGIRTNIAKAAKMNDSLKSLGMDPNKSIKQFDKFLRTPPEEAARQILNAVLKDKRRLLIGTDARIWILSAFIPTGYQRLAAIATKMM